MPLIKNGALVDDPWVTLADDQPLPASGPVIVSLPRWRAERDALIARSGLLGVRLAAGEMVEPIAADLLHLALIALEFSSFRDGRAYSKARLLRERLGFTGELRAVGNVLRDQLLFMQRCGIDAFAIAGAHAIEDWRRALTEFTVFYQPTADGRTPVSWLRQRRRAAE